jgi:uncharacterized protein YecE (DUF72 family)
MRPARVGTCGWNYKDWSGVFYPNGLRPADQLPYYAEHFPIVEADSTFYATPAVKTVQGRREKTPNGFGFSLKVPQVITHAKVSWVREWPGNDPQRRFAREAGSGSG